MFRRDGFFIYLECMRLISLNGNLLDADHPVLPATDRSYRYGDGLFETIRVKNEKLILGNFHFERLRHSMELLKYPVAAHFTQTFFESEVLRLCRENNCSESARVRFSVSGGDGGLYDGDNRLRYLIECWPLNLSTELAEKNGSEIDIFPDVRKSMDVFSTLKSASFMPYVRAARWAKEKKLNDALLLNTSGRVADSTIANVFWVKNHQVFTPPLSEGCIAGVMRRYLLEHFAATDYRIKEQPLELSDLEHAEEVFLTNAIRGIRWVSKFRNKKYAQKLSSFLAEQLERSIGR